MIISGLRPLVEAAPGDHTKRVELARALAGHGRHAEAIDHLLEIIAANREWNEGAARTVLLEVFEAAGQSSDVTKTGRKRLSSILYS